MRIGLVVTGVALALAIDVAPAAAQVFKPRSATTTSTPAKTTPSKADKSAKVDKSDAGDKTDKADKADKVDKKSAATTARKPTRSPTTPTRRGGAAAKKSRAAVGKGRPDDLTPDPKKSKVDNDYVVIEDDSD